ncbi:hypothetical protein FOA52_003595 [Chlamydomonas sp. UWO 241]|nr:hypothetical protein FOA52_003595 [Chlamydomonas sp. UWO 241]
MTPSRRQDEEDYADEGQQTHPSQLGVTRGPEHSLINLITDCKTANGLFSLARQHGHAWDSIHASAALTRAANLLVPGARRSPDTRTGAALLLRLARERLPQMGNEGLVSTLWAVSKLGISDAEFVGAFVRQARATLPRLYATVLATTADALAKLGRQDTPVREMLDIALTITRTSKVPTFTAQNLSNMLWAIATTGLGNTFFISLLLMEAKPKLPDFLPQNLANTAWALATLGHKDDAFMRALLGEAKLQLPGFNVTDVLQTSYALAKLNINDTEFQRMLAARSTQLGMGE